MATVARIYQASFEKNPRSTLALTNGTLSAVADACAQSVQLFVCSSTCQWSIIDSHSLLRILFVFLRLVVSTRTRTTQIWWRSYLEICCLWDCHGSVHIRIWFLPHAHFWRTLKIKISTGPLMGRWNRFLEHSFPLKSIGGKVSLNALAKRVGADQTVMSVTFQLHTPLLLFKYVLSDSSLAIFTLRAPIGVCALQLSRPRSYSTSFLAYLVYFFNGRYGGQEYFPNSYKISWARLVKFAMFHLIHFCVVDDMFIPAMIANWKVWPAIQVSTCFTSRWYKLIRSASLSTFDLCHFRKFICEKIMGYWASHSLSFSYRVPFQASCGIFWTLYLVCTVYHREYSSCLTFSVYSPF
jgi:hypothetical protein